MERELCELLAYMSASALECVDEPSPYGALRLLGGVEQLLRFGFRNHLLHDERLYALADRIEEEKNTALTDKPYFCLLVEEAALTLTGFV